MANGKWGGQSNNEGARLRAKRDKGGYMANGKPQLKNGGRSLQPGFTLTELLITMTIFATLAGIATMSLVGAKQRTSLNTSVEMVSADLRQQQLKSMVGDTGGRTTPDRYGIHFGTSEYTLFHGSTFNLLESSNFTVQLGDNITFVSPPTDLIFDRVSGELSVGGNIILRDNTTKATKTLQFNKYGVITSVN